MGVELDAPTITAVSDGGKAQAAGWQAGDVIVAIDGVAVSSQSEIRRELQAGGPKKTVTLKRGEETLESVLDYSDDPDEARRAERAASRRAAVEARAERRREGDGQ
jgi:S1-C subfamily serine protease